MFNKKDSDEIISKTLQSQNNVNAALCLHENFNNLRREIIKKFFTNLQEDLENKHNFVIENGFKSSFEIFTKFTYEFTLYPNDDKESYYICIENQSENLENFSFGIRKKRFDQKDNPELKKHVIELLGERFNNNPGRWWVCQIGNIDKSFDNFNETSILADMFSEESKLKNLFVKMFVRLKETLDDYMLAFKDTKTKMAAY